MGVDQAGQDSSATEIDHFRLGPDQRIHRRVRTDGHDLVAVQGDGVDDRPTLILGVNLAVMEDQVSLRFDLVRPCAL